MRKVILYLVALVSITLCFGQDQHYAQYNTSPGNINPGMVGMFNGSIRFTLNYRNQYRSVIDNPFNRISGTAEMGLFKSRQGINTISAGVGVNSDRAGAANLGFTSGTFYLAGAKSMDFEGKSVVSLGIATSYFNRSIDYTSLTFDGQFDGRNFNSDLPNGENFTINSFNYMEVSAGLFWYYTLKRDFNFYGGFSGYHLNSPQLSFMGDDQIRQQHKYNLHGGLTFPLKDNLALSPGLVFSKQGPLLESLIGAMLRYEMEGVTGSDKTIHTGLRFRMSGNYTNAISPDALIILLQYELSKLKLGFSYDMTVSNLSSTNKSRGGLEASVVYIIPGKQKGKISRVSCPKF